MTPVPSADWLFTLTSNGASGTIIVDHAVGPTGEFVLATGSVRLRQRIFLWLLSPQGSNPFAPTYGNPLLSMLGQPNDGGTDQFEEMIERCEAYFLQTQTQDAANGQLSTDEMVASFSSPALITFPIPGTVVISFTVFAVSGNQQTLSVPFSLTVGG